MDGDRLDALARSLGTGGSRRRLLGGVLAGSMLATPAAQVSAKKKKHRCPACRRCGSRCCATGQACAAGSCVTPCIGASCGTFPAACPLLPADNVWHARIDALPVDESSSTYVNTIGANTGLHPDFGSAVLGGGPIGIPFVVVPGGTPEVPVRFDEAADESDPGPYPIPAAAPIEGGPCGDGDRHVLVVDSDTCTLYELFNARPQAGGEWTAGSGAIFDLKSNQLRPEGWTSADAAGLPILPGLVRFEEVAAGEIRHALRFTAPRTRDEFVWPATHEASSDSNPNLPPLGQRFRLKANVDLSGFSSTNRVILTALQRYGMFLADNGSAWFFSGVPDPRWDDDDLHALQDGITGSDFEAIDESSLQVSPDSGQARQP